MSPRCATSSSPRPRRTARRPPPQRLRPRRVLLHGPSGVPADPSAQREQLHPDLPRPAAVRLPDRARRGRRHSGGRLPRGAQQAPRTPGGEDARGRLAAQPQLLGPHLHRLAQRVRLRGPRRGRALLRGQPDRARLAGRGNLRTGQVRPGIITHPATGEEVWFNHLVFWNEWSLDEELRETLIDEFGRDQLPFNTAFGDGTTVTREDLAAIQTAYDAATVRARWRPGDLLLVDNILTAHGRDPFRGDRKIAVAMGAPVELSACRPTIEPAAAFA